MSFTIYNSVLDALSKNGKFDEVLKLFDRMVREHWPLRSLAVNLWSFNAMADGYCGQGMFKEAIEVFRKMVELIRCRPNTLSFNNFIEQLFNNVMIVEAEFQAMEEGGAESELAEKITEAVGSYDGEVKSDGASEQLATS